MSIPTPDDSTSSISDDAAVAALVDSFGPKGKAEVPTEDDDADEGEDDDNEQNDPADDGNEGEDADEGDDEDAGEGDEGEEGEEPAAKPAKSAADDQVVEVTVDGVTTEHTVASLKRLAGQEASLTRKSQEADVVGSRAAAALNAAVETALEDLEPYKGVDWLVLQNQLDPGEFEWHRANAAKAQSRFDKLVGSAQSVDEVLGARRQNVSVEQAQDAVRELKADVPNWSDKLYGDIMAYGVTQGLDEADVKSIANAKVIKLLHKAMLHDAGKKAVAKKVKAAPEKVLRSSRQAAPETKSAAAKQSAKRLQSGRGSDADAIAVLTGRWS